MARPQFKILLARSAAIEQLLRHVLDPNSGCISVQLRLWKACHPLRSVRCARLSPKLAYPPRTSSVDMRPSTTLAECVFATAFQGVAFGNMGTAETAAEG